MISGQDNSSTISPELNLHLAEELNAEMASSVLPVTIFVGIETVFGFLGNLLILYVFIFRYHSCNFKYFVLCLAFIDTTSTLTTMPGEIVTQMFWYVYPVPIVCKIKSFFNVFTVCGSAFCLLLIAVDRYRKICYPLDWQIKPRVARILCYLLQGVSFIMALPCAFLWGTQSYQLIYKGHEITVTICEKDGKYLHTDYPLGYIVTVEVIISIILIILFVLYVFVCRILLTTKSAEEEKIKATKDGITNRALAGLKSVESEMSLSHGLTSDEELSTQNSVDGVQDKTERTKQTRRQSIGTRNVHKSKSNAGMDIKVKRPTLKQQARRVRRKTLIMFILTAVFISTTVLYLTLLSLIADDFLQTLSSHEKATYFFFFRLYFINHAINPILYGFLDPHFRRVLKQIARSLTAPCKGEGDMTTSVSYSTSEQ